MNACRAHRLAALPWVLLIALGAASAHADSFAAAPAAPAPEAAPSRAEEAAPVAAPPGSQTSSPEFPRHRRRENDVVGIGRDSHLEAGTRADAVVSINGSASSDGDAREVVSILGDTRVGGPVRDSAVSVLGSTHVDSAVEGDVVAILGGVELGPHAQVGGDVVVVGGTLTRAPSAVIHGKLQSIATPRLDWLRPWIDHCLLYGRPLALVHGIEWVWALAFALLALYVGLAAIFREGLMRCVGTLEAEPGRTALAALLTALLWPLLLVLLGVTLIGLAAVPFVGLGLLCAALFGKAAVLAWIGGRCLGPRASGPLGPAAAVLVGGLIVLVLYLIPVLGFIAYQVLGLLGLGTVIYTGVKELRQRRAAPSSGASPAAASGSSASSAGTTAAPAAPTPPPAAPGALLPRAGFWLRMAALLIDAMLVGFLMGMLHHAFDLHLLALAVYGALMWKLRGSTVGGIVLDLRVVRLDGQPIGWETAVVRALSCFLSLAVAGLGFFWIAFDDGKQAWHDKIAGTAVVHLPKAARAHDGHEAGQSIA